MSRKKPIRIIKQEHTDIPLFIRTFFEVLYFFTVADGIIPWNGNNNYNTKYG
jgi:hypothetical protein